MNLKIETKLERKGFTLELNESLEGKVFGVFGPSGSGKTTLLHVLAGLVRPASGRIVLDGEVLLDTQAGIFVPAHKRKIGLVFQEGRLFPHLTVRRNLEYGMPADPSLRRWSLEYVANLFQINNLLDKKPSELSGGERQRVALGRAILMSPRLLLLDEPLASLDAGLKAEIIPFLRMVKEQVGIPMIYVSHDLTEILDLTTSLLVIDGGRVLSRGSLYEILKNKRASALLRHGGLVNILKLKFVRTVSDDHLAQYALEDGGNPAGSCRIYGPLIKNNADGIGASDSDSTLDQRRHTVASYNLIQNPQSELSVGSHGVRSTSQKQSGQDRTIHAVLDANDIIISVGPHEGLSTRCCIQGRIMEIQIDEDRALCVVEGAVRLMVEITPLAVREMGLAVGQEVHCLFKAHAMRFLE